MMNSSWKWCIAGLVGMLLLAVAGCTAGPGGAGDMPTAPDEETAIAVVESSDAETADPGVPFSVRFEMPPTYRPGEAMPVSVAMEYTGQEPVTALALRLALPPGWQFAGVSGELRPAIEPPAGTRDELTFVWIKIPAFPAVFECMLDTPTEAPGPVSISAQGIYRGLAGEMQSPVVAIPLAVEG